MAKTFADLDIEAFSALDKEAGLSITKTIPGTITTFKGEPSVISPHKPSTWESLKSVLFPTEVGYGPRLAPITRPEKFFRAVEFGPRVALTTIGSAFERTNVAATGFLEPTMAAIGKGRFETIETGELKRLPKTITAGLKSALRRPGFPREAPTYGEALAESYYEPLLKEKAPTWFAPSQDVAFETALIFGPKAFKQFKTSAARKTFFKKVGKITSKYDAAVESAKASGDPKLAITIKQLRAAEQAELAPLVTSKLTTAAKIPPKWMEATEEARVVQLANAKKAGAKFAAELEAQKVAQKIELEKPVAKLTRLIKGAKRIGRAKLAAQQEARKPKVAAFARELREAKGDTAFRRAFSKLRGRLTEEGAFTAPRNQMTNADMTSLVDQLRTTKRLQPLEKGVAWEGLKELFSGTLPQKHKLKLLEREFGTDLIKAAQAWRTLGEKATAGFVDVLNLPRTLLTAYDLSASLRQNMLAGVRHPVKWSKAFTAQLKAFGSEKNANAIDDVIRGSKWYRSAKANGLYLPTPTGISDVAATRPEEFMSRTARYLPGIKASERAFVTMGNKLRFELYSKYSEMFTKADIATPSNMKQLAHYLNAATGRGDLYALEKHGASLNALLFSPRYIASRFQSAAKSAQILPSTIISGVTAGKIPINPVSKIAATDMVTFVGANTAVLASIKFYYADNPDIDVEIDPRSSDFGKIRIGNTRLEPWAGFQPLVRYTAQLMTGERKQTITGRVSDIEKPKVAIRFGRSKLAPVPGFIIDAATGQSFVGDEVSMAKLKEVSTENLAYQKFFPLAFQDIVEAVEYQGGTAAALTVPSAILGIGTGSWDTSPSQNLALQQDEVSRRTFGKAWEDTGPIAQNMMRNQNRNEWDELEVQKRFEQKQFGSLEFIAREQKQASQNIKQKLNSSILKSLEEIQIKVPAVSRRLGDWRMNKSRFKQYQDLVAEQINSRLADEVKTESWKTSSVKIRRNVANNIIKNAKQTARNKVKLDANEADW